MTSTAPQLLPYLERLLDGETVEWKTLGEVCLVQRGASPRPIANYLTSSSDGIPWIKIGDTKVGSKYIESTQERISIEGAQRSRQLSAGDFILSNSMSYGRPYILKIDGAIHDGWASLSEISSSILSDYLFYFLSSSKVQMYWEGKINSGSVSNLNADIIKALPIPIPPLRVQARIVEILDKFTQLEAELEAELEARNKQYDFYRNRLLTGPLPHSLNIPHQWEQVPLGSIGEVRMCKRILKQDTTETGEIPFYKIGTFGKSADAFISRTLFEEYKQKYAYPRIGDILISASGTIGRAIEFDGQDAYFQDSNIVWLEHDDSKVLNRFLYYCYQIADWKVSKGGTISRLYNDNIKKTLIPLPPLSEQRRIVEILDRFDTLTNSISEGLPREIALRRKQYEYYRDALLRFPPPAPTA